MALLLLICTFSGISQQRKITAVIADSVTRQPLAFATVREVQGRNGAISGLDGLFTITVPDETIRLQISYAGYETRMMFAGGIYDGDTILLAPRNRMMGEVVIRASSDRIRRIINTAVASRGLHNPDRYDQYSCMIYYKSWLDIGEMTAADSTEVIKFFDSSFRSFTDNSHLFLTETYSRRLYRRPASIQETVLASRISGLSKTWFANIITDAIPFHIYQDYLLLNGKDYINPVAPGWQQRYDFRLLDEMQLGGDTVFILSFKPRNSGFNGLTGRVYINTDGYAISHFTASNDHENTPRTFSLEQIYSRTSGRWFPYELNYEQGFSDLPMEGLRLTVSGRSRIDSVSYGSLDHIRFDRARPVRLHDSVDLRTAEEWRNYRKDTLSAKEQLTYRIIDSFSKAYRLEKMAEISGKLIVGRLPVGKVDLDINRIVVTNRFEGMRIGAGFYSNDKFIRNFSAGGWFGYGTRDKEWKYGISATLYTARHRDDWLRIFMDNSYRTPGEVLIHPDLDRTGFTRFLLVEPDRYREMGLSAGTRSGFLQAEAGILSRKTHAFHPLNYSGRLLNRFDAFEGSLKLRYAFGEKRLPVFEFYLPSVSKFPVLYSTITYGHIRSDGYRSGFMRLAAAATFSKRINRWGRDDFRLEAGWTGGMSGTPLPRSYLAGGRGFMAGNPNFYAWGGFITMRPFEYFNDQYVSLLYRHEFNWYLWSQRFSRPFIGIGHNMAFGGLSESNSLANPGIRNYAGGYHESGLIMNHLLRIDFKFAVMAFNAGIFIHWADRYRPRELVYTFGSSYVL